LGSNTRQTSTAQGSIASRQYDAFGNLAATSGTWVGPFAFVGAEGYQEDTDSGLQLLGHRHYDSSTGRFLTRDPIKDDRNWNGYCGNNPVKFVDPTGVTLGVVLLALTDESTVPGIGSGRSQKGWDDPEQTYKD
jgi:RHS repeat-associated protein